MRTLLNLIAKNLSNLFTLLGIILTIYFSGFYIPSYVREVRNERIRIVHNSLIETIQELVYNKHNVDSDDLITLIKGKELRYDIEYPYTTDELLIQTQEQFIDNKFIPLRERKELVDKIDSMRTEIRELNIEDIREEITSDWFIIFSTTLSVFIGLVVSILGVWNFSIRIKKQKEDELADGIAKEQDEIKDYLQMAISYENLVGDILKEFSTTAVIERQSVNKGVDFLLDSSIGKLAIEVKYKIDTTKPLFYNSIKKIMLYAHKNNIQTILVTNALLTNKILEEVKKFNSDNPNSIISIIQGETREELKEKLSKYFVKK